MHTGSEGNLQDSVFPCRHESPGERTQNLGIGRKRLYSLRHLTSPRLIFLYETIQMSWHHLLRRWCILYPVAFVLLLETS